jgi:pilus assembly protein CpaB
MRILAFLVLGFGISLAGGGVYYISEFMEQQKVAPITTEYVTVLAASERLASGDLLQAGQLKYISIPRQAVPKGAYTSTTALFGDLGDRKRYIARSFEPGELILEGKLSNSSRNGDIPPNMRIVSIPINAVTGVSGFVSAGDRVDILMIRGEDGQLVSQVVLEDVLVYAVDQRSDTEGTTPRTGRTATVMVKSRDAQLLTVAQGVGRLSLSLRGKDATGIDKSGRVTTKDLDDFVKPDAIPKNYIWINRGGVREKILIE